MKPRNWERSTKRKIKETDNPKNGAAWGQAGFICYVIFMTPCSSDKEKYNTGYFGWLIAYSKYWFSVPVREFDELIEWAQMTLFLIGYLILVVAFPITFPVLALFTMIDSKRKMVKDHGKDALDLDT